MNNKNHYAKRDAMALGKYYTAHVSAMTREKLFTKSDIAAELAHSITTPIWRGFTAYQRRP